MNFKRRDEDGFAAIAYRPWDDSPFQTRLAKSYMEYVNDDNFLVEVHLWCADNKCGRRTSYGVFEFRNEAELMFFMLKWS